jgi:ketosteroid isomerase-like protein
LNDEIAVDAGMEKAVDIGAAASLKALATAGLLSFDAWSSARIRGVVGARPGELCVMRWLRAATRAFAWTNASSINGRAGARLSFPDGLRHPRDMADDLIAFVRDMDRCWMEGRFDDLVAFIADDVVMVGPGGAPRMQGSGVAVDSYREFVGRCEVSLFRTYGHVVTHRGQAAVVEYGWDMAWRDGSVDHEARGREILVLAFRDDGWRVVWRTQLPS